MDAEDKQRHLEYLTTMPDIGMEMISFICGEFVGKGCTREVYEFQLDDKYVVKVAYGSPIDNVVEWQIWQNLKHRTDGSREWFAPCKYLSKNGRILVQRRTQPLETREAHIPDKVPTFFTDIKRSNYGWIGKQLVCHDYAYSFDMMMNYASPNRLQSFKRKL